MGCNCKKRTPVVNEIKVNAAMQMMANDTTRLVNLDGVMVPFYSVPKGSLYIRGAWYSSPATLSEELIKEFPALYKKWVATVTASKVQVQSKVEPPKAEPPKSAKPAPSNPVQKSVPVSQPTVDSGNASSASTDIDSAPDKNSVE